MNKFVSGKVSIFAIVTVFTVATFLLGKSLNFTFAKAGDVPKAYCHAAGQSGTLHFNYHFNRAWTSHFLDNGTPKAGHEDDFYTVTGDKDCDGQVDPTPTPGPTATPEPSPEGTPTPEPTPELTDACKNIDGFQDFVPDGYEVDRNDDCVPDVCPNLDGIQSSIPDTYHKDPGTINCIQYELGGPPPPSAVSGGQVLGASTMAATGGFEEMLYQAIMGIGGLFTLKGIKGLKKAKKFSKKI